MEILFKVQVVNRGSRRRNHEVSTLVDLFKKVLEDNTVVEGIKKVYDNNVQLHPRIFRDVGIQNLEVV